MDHDRESKISAALNVHFRQTIEERIDKYEKQVDSSFERLLSRLKHEDDAVKSSGDSKLDEFTTARRREFVKKLTCIRETLLKDFLKDLADLISSKYSNNMNAFDKDLTKESFDELVTLFKQLKVTDSTEIKCETFSDVIDLFDSLNISGKGSNLDIVEVPEKLTVFGIKSPTPDEFSDESEDGDVVEVMQRLDSVNLISDESDISIDENECNQTIRDEKLIHVEVHDLAVKKEQSPVADESVPEESFVVNEEDILKLSLDIRRKIRLGGNALNNDVKVDEPENREENISVQIRDLLIEEKSALVSIESFSSNETVVLASETDIAEAEPVCLARLNRQIKKCDYEALANGRINTALDFSNFMFNKGLLKFEERLSEQELKSRYNRYEVEVKPKVSIANQVLDVLKSTDVLKDLNNDEVEFKETFFLNQHSGLNINANDVVPFNGEVLRTLDPGFVRRQTALRCTTCKECFTSKDKFDVHINTEMHILKTIYFRDRAWFKKDVDYLQINGIPDLIVKQNDATTCEISCVNVNRNKSKIYLCKIFELVHSGVEMKIEYGSNYCLEKGDSFKIIMRARYASLLTSETLYPIVLKVFRNDIDEYNYILIEPHFTVDRTSRNGSRPLHTLPPSLKNYRPPLKTQNENNKRCIIAEPSDPFRQIIRDGLYASRSNIRIDRTPSTDNHRVNKDIPIYVVSDRSESAKREKQPISSLPAKVKDEVLAAPRIERALKMPKMNLVENSIPQVLKTLIKFNFKTATFVWTPMEKILLENIRKCLCDENTLRLQHSKDFLCERNYIDRLHIMMWIEEYEALEEIRSYSQKGIDLLTDKLSQNLVGITLLGLSEGRPSILKGDYITVTVRSPKLPKGFKKCEGSVQLIEEKAIYVKLHRTFYTEEYWKYKADVEFKFNRTPIKMSHTALNNIRGSKWQESLFPRSFERNPNNTQLRRFFNESIGDNQLQMQAVTNIVQNRASPAPYILFGPPGTGKTATLVEAITQIWSTMAESRICVCASSNTAADVIAKRLLQYIPITEIVRIYGLSRNDAEIISELQGCCNYDARAQEIFFPSMSELYSKRIIVMTPVTAGRFVLSYSMTFDYLFMDEAGHALEVDILIPFIGFLRNERCGFVLAGDPQQLGPVVRSPYANALGYGMSLLERLMTQCDIYKKDKITGNYNPRVITKLVNNYRSHETILRIPNQRFYESELRAKASKKVISSLCQWRNLPSKGFPIIFHSVKGKEERENNSPSYFNSSEVDVVANYVHDLFNSRGVQIDQSEVGIISPYRKQVHKIRQRLLRSFPKINVASVEEFQGQERRVIIISTVRSRHELLATDYKYGLGFLKNEKRFNVAITRAIALLVVIGNPDILQCDPHWREFLKYCTENSAFIGEPANGTVPNDFNPSANVDMHLHGFNI